MLSIASNATPSRIAIHSGARQKAGVKDEPPTKRRLRLGNPWWWFIAIFFCVIGWQMWKLHLYDDAVREAEEAGFKWTCVDTISLIRQDWSNALRNETWVAHERFLQMGKVHDLGRYREMLHRLRPTGLGASGCENLDALKDLIGLQKLFLHGCTALKNVDALKELSSLQKLDLGGCYALKNLDGLKDLAELQVLNLIGCPALQNLDGLKGLTRLQKLFLYDCPALQNADVFNALIGLQKLELRSCHALQNVEGLKYLAGLQEILLMDCDKIPAAALRELRAALPNTDITFPDGSKNPPQE